MAAQSKDTKRTASDPKRGPRTSPARAASSTRQFEGKGTEAFNRAAADLAQRADLRDTDPPPGVPVDAKPPAEPAEPEIATKTILTPTKDAVDLLLGMRKIGALLSEPFDPRDIEWRLQQAGTNSAGKPWGKALAYVTARAIMNRLDAIVGPGSWQDFYRHGPDGGVMCGIGVRVGPEWIWKYDGAGNPTASGGLSAADSVKGGYSNSFKRAAVKWGIGRYLYDLEEGWVQIVEERGYGFQPKREKNGREVPAFHWNPPALPVWALPNAPEAEDTERPLPRSAEPVASRPPASAKSTTPSSTPKAGTRSGASTTSTPASAAAPKAAKPNAEPGSLAALGREISTLMQQLKDAKHPRYDELLARVKAKKVSHPTDHNEWVGVRDALAHLLKQHIGDADQEGDTVSAPPSTNSAAAKAPLAKSIEAARRSATKPAASADSSAAADPAPVGGGGVPNSRIDLDARPMVDHVGSSIMPACPTCGTMMHDERDSKKNAKAPDFRCDRPQCDGKFWPNQFQKEFARGDFENKPVFARPRVGGEWQEATVKMTPSGFPMAT